MYEKYEIEGNYCKCGNLLNDGEEMCFECVSKREKLKSNKPSLEELLEFVNKFNYSKTAKIYGVSDKTIRNWIESYGVYPPSKSKKPKLVKKINIVKTNDKRFNINKLTRKVERPSYDNLIDEINEFGYHAVGRKYGVTHTTIIKWVKTYEKYGE